MTKARVDPSQIEALTVPSSGDLRDAARAISAGFVGAAFVVDNETDKFIRVITDGDLRRALLQKLDADSLITKLPDDRSVVGRVGMSAEEISGLFSDSVRVIPLLDNDNRVVDMAVFDSRMYLPTAEPYFDEKELKYVTEAVSSGWVSSAGKFIGKFEEAFSRFVGSEFAVSCSSGTAALHLALKAFDIGAGDEVIVPTLTFIATASSVVHAGATPVFADSEIKTLNIDPEKIEQCISERTKAIIVVHLYGHPADMDPIVKIAKRHNLIVIEDAVEAHGARYKGRMVGSIGDIATFSFYGNKVITTGEGGLVVTNRGDIAERVRLLRDHGMDRSKGYWHPVLGFNYRMTNMQAALGVAQMEKITEIIQRKRMLAKGYSELLHELPGLTTPKEMDWATHIYWLYTILIDNHVSPVNRDALVRGLVDNGIDARPVFVPMHKQPIFDSGGKFPTAEKISQQGLTLPSSVNLLEVDQLRVGNTIQALFLAK